jgi:hypothetical protein
MNGEKHMLKLYVFILNSLSFSQKAVQAGHAVSIIASQNPQIDWTKQTFVYLNASRIKLKKLLLHRLESDPTYSYFIEPDYNNQLTSVAIFGKEGEYSTFNLL